jgi:hypothetical protein
MATKVIAGFKQRDVGLVAQPVRHRQAGNARADDGQLHGPLSGCVAAGTGRTTEKELGINLRVIL